MEQNGNTNEYYELNADEFYAYGFANEEWAHMKYEVVLHDPVDPGLLQDALTLMYERFPYFKVMLSVEENPERFVLRRNTHQAKVFESENYIALDNPALGGYLISVSYFRRNIKFQICHLLTDGVGVKKILKTFLIFYFKMRYIRLCTILYVRYLKAIAIPRVLLLMQETLR